MKLSFLLTILFLNIFLIKVFPQVDVKMIVRNPVPSEISVWAEDPTILQVVVSNMSSKDLPNCCLGFNITNEKGDRVIKSNIKSPSIPKFNIPTAPSVTMLNGNKIFNINSVTFNQRLMSLALSTNSIPEGDYEICVSVYDQYGKNITNGEEYCTGFSIYIPEPPILISPVDDDLLINAYPTFLWTPVTNYNPGRTQIKYKLKICPIYQGQTPRDAIDRNKVLFEKNDIYTTSYQYLPSDMAFDYFFNVTHFVWIIQAFDANNNPASSHEGKSELGIFKTVEESSNEVLYTNIFPEINDTIPWITPHLVTQFEPYADDIRSVNMKLSLHDENSTQTFTNNSTINFPQGPLASQQLINQEKASWLISNLDQTKAFATWMQNLEEGKKYFWKTEATFTKANGTTVTASTNETGFVIGLKQPTALFPKVDTSIQVNTIIETGLTIPSPNMLNLISAQELENFNFHGHNSYSTAAANVLFELSKTESFDSLMQSKTVQIPVGDELKSGNNCDDLFKNISTSFDAIADTGTYYWRAKYLNTNNLPYYTSAARRLKIVPILLATCFEMEVQQPANEGKWTKNKKPCFSVSVNPEINKSAITGGRIKVWIMDSDNENLTDVKKRGTVLDIAFTGNDDTKIYAHTTDLNGYTRYDLNFINGSDSTSTAFLPDSAAYYAWNFKLDYNKDSIRIDQQVCDSSYVMSNDGVFQQMPVSKKKNSCPGECFAEAPTNTSPGSQTLAKDSIISIGNFKIKLISVSGSPSSLTGEGSIDVPYMRANILVEFTGLQVNNENQVYGGEAYAKIDVDAPYTETEGNDFEDQAYSFASDKLKFKQIHEKSASLGKLVSGFTGTTPVTLPIGYDNDFDGYKFVVGIVGMRFTPTQGTLNATTYVELPSLGTDVGIGLGGKNICFHKDGLGGMDKAVLYLAQDFGYNSEESWDFLFKAPTSSDLGTYVMWDCEGMSDLEIAADVAFPRSWMTPVGNNDANAQVKAHFKGHSKPYGNTWQWMASASLDECELAGAEGYKIEIQDMVFDFSDTINPTGITYPAIYTGKKTTEWKGFYIKRATLTLPESMKTFDDENPKFAITNLLIDRVGITGSLAGSNLIQYPKGDFGGWGASIDSLKIDMVNSSLQSGSMKGRIKMSIADSSFNYSGLIAKNNVVSPNNKSKLKYQFSIAPKDTVDIDFVKSKINILPTSTIEMNNTEGNFVAQAVLNGVLEMDGEIGILKKIDFKGIKFEGFTVKSESPYFDLGAWGLASPSHGIAGFPVSIKNIEMVTGDRNGSFGAGLKFDLDIALQEEAMKGTTTLSVWGKMASESGAQHFEFDKIELDAIGINVDMGAVKIKGDLNLYNSDPTFGNGFRGAIDATFIDQVEITSTAQFGSVDGYRYWYVDGKALFNTGIPFAGISVYGFGGGAWYHMSKSGSTNLKEKSTSIDEGTTPGKTNSGFTFLPDENIGLGLKASIVMGTSKPDAFNGDVGLEAQFLSDGGIGEISMIGDGYMFCGITERDKAKIEANVNLNYNFPLKTFHGVFDIDINEPIKGDGTMTMHFSPNLWYLKIGEPSKKINLNLASWLSTDGYFMIGQDLPTPQLPSQMVALFPDYSPSPNSEIARGDGFAFGASASFKADGDFLIFYGNVSALVGFDLALLNYGENTTCEGGSGTIGLNGWYASGQIYASVAATIGMEIDLWFINGKYEILDMQVAAMLKGAGPNPTWIKGAVSGDYEILSGAIKGYCNYKFSVGDQCQMESENPISRMDLISDINPVSGENNVNVYTEPQIAMNFKLESQFDLVEMAEGEDDVKKIRTFRIKLGDLSLRKTTNNDSIPGQLNIGSDKVSAYYKPHDIMAANSNYRFSASAYGEELINNRWVLAKKKDGTSIKQVEFTDFKTGAAPDVIEKQNVAYTYPITSQQYLLQNECRAGHIKLISGQPGLFAPRDDYDLELIARFIPIDIDFAPVEVPFTYNATSRSISFVIPLLMNNKDYYLQMVKKEVLNNEEMIRLQNALDFMENRDAQLTPTLTKLIFNKDGSTVRVNDRKISKEKVNEGEKLLYVFSFRTSKYNSLQAKLNSFNYVSTQSEFGVSNQETHTATYTGGEYFGYYDFNPVRWTSSGTSHQVGPLIKIDGSGRYSQWHRDFVIPDVYSNIGWMKGKGYWSGGSTYDLYNTNPNYNFVDVEHNSIAALSARFRNNQTRSSNGEMSINQSDTRPNLVLTYNHGLIVPKDYWKLQDRVIEVLSSPYINLSNSSSIKLRRIFDYMQYEPMLRGNYALRFSYNYFGSSNLLSKSFVY